MPLLQPESPVSGWQHVGFLQSLKKQHLILIHDSCTMFSFHGHPLKAWCKYILPFACSCPWPSTYSVEDPPWAPPRCCSYRSLKWRIQGPPAVSSMFVSYASRSRKICQWGRAWQQKRAMIGRDMQESFQTGTTLDYMCKCTTKVLLFHQLWATLCKAKGIDPWPTMPLVEKTFCIF